MSDDRINLIMVDLPIGDNTSVSGFANSTSGIVSDNNTGVQSIQGPLDSEVSMNTQIDEGPSAPDVDAQVNQVITNAVGQATNSTPVISTELPIVTQTTVDPGDSKNPKVKSEVDVPLVFNAITAFVAGLVVVGIVYAFTVSGSLDRYKSVVLGVSNQVSE